MNAPPGGFVAVPRRPYDTWDIAGGIAALGLLTVGTVSYHRAGHLRDLHRTRQDSRQITDFSSLYPL